MGSFLEVGLCEATAGGITGVFDCRSRARSVTAADLAAMPTNFVRPRECGTSWDGRLVVMPCRAGLMRINANIVYQAGHPPKDAAPAKDLTAEGIVAGFV